LEANLRLLVVEDDPDLNRQLTTALTDAGYVVDRAFDGEEGHFLGDSEPYDAVVLDIGLPKMDGISVLEAWRRAGRAMPVIALLLFSGLWHPIRRPGCVKRSCCVPPITAPGKYFRSIRCSF
jgi:CheY-like chemotaxis protein